MASTPRFKPLQTSDLPMLHSWFQRSYVRARWPESTVSQDAVNDFLPLCDPAIVSRGFVAYSEDRPVGFIQRYDVMRTQTDVWWLDETDPGARGTDQILVTKLI